MIESLIREFENRQNPQPVYFYCSRNPSEPERSRPDIILGSIARQLSCATDGGIVLGPAQDFFTKRKQKGFTSVPPNLEESINLIIALSCAYPITNIIIDALDECNQESRLVLLKSLKKIMVSSPSLIKVFVSSREDYDIVLHLNHCPNLEISACRNEADVESFIDKVVDESVSKKQLLSGKPPSDLVKLIKEVFRQQAGTM